MRHTGVSWCGFGTTSAVKGPLLGRTDRPNHNTVSPCASNSGTLSPYMFAEGRYTPTHNSSSGTWQLWVKQDAASHLQQGNKKRMCSKTEGNLWVSFKRTHRVASGLHRHRQLEEYVEAPSVLWLLKPTEAASSWTVRKSRCSNAVRMCFFFSQAGFPHPAFS